jgi:hypothetical protein
MRSWPSKRATPGPGALVFGKTRCKFFTVSIKVSSLLKLGGPVRVSCPTHVARIPDPIAVEILLQRIEAILAVVQVFAIGWLASSGTRVAGHELGIVVVALM